MLIISYPFPIFIHCCVTSAVEKSLLSDKINNLRTLCFLLDALAKLQTVTAVSFVMCLHLHGTTGLPLDGFLLDALAKLQTGTAVSFVMCLHLRGTTGLPLDGF